MLFESGEVWQLVCTTTNFANWSSASSPDQIFPKKVKKRIWKARGSQGRSSTSLYYISLSLGFGNMINIQISISERSSGWAINYSSHCLVLKTLELLIFTNMLCDCVYLNFSLPLNILMIEMLASNVFWGFFVENSATTKKFQPWLRGERIVDWTFHGRAGF